MTKSVMETDQRESALPTDSEARKGLPMATGVLDYFPAALAAVAELSKVGNDKHNPGEPLHWARGKSMDHADTIMRHLAERGTVDTDGMLHDVKVAWRALAMLQEELEKRGAPMSRGSRVADKIDAEIPRCNAHSNNYRCTHLLGHSGRHESIGEFTGRLYHAWSEPGFAP